MKLRAPIVHWGSVMWAACGSGKCEDEEGWSWDNTRNACGTGPTWAWLGNFPEDARSLEASLDAAP